MAAKRRRRRKKCVSACSRGLARPHGEIGLAEDRTQPGVGLLSAAPRGQVPAHDIIQRAGLRELAGAYPVLSEESSSEQLAGRRSWERYWLVDPLDGTSNFLHGLPHWAISIALEHKGQIVSAVVYDAAKDEMFYAEKGAGAWMNDSKRLRVSGRHKMVEAVFATGIPFAAKRTLPATLQDLARLMPVCAGVRRFGAASLDLAYVAAGRFDGFWERELQPWDIAAGMLLVTEAGGMVGPIREGHQPLEHGDIVAANGELFTGFANIVRTRS